MTRYALASDLDGTLIPMGPQPAGGGIDIDAVEEFSRHFVPRRGTALAYVTGRHLPLALEGIRDTGLPAPDYLSCDVGTTLYRPENGTWTPDAAYAEFVQTALGNVNAEGVRQAVAREFPELEPQEAEKQSAFKMSYYVDPAVDWPRMTHRLAAFLGTLGARVNLVFSIDPVAAVGMLDLLPDGVSKYSAVRAVARRMGLDPVQVVYAGDSGNDAEALLGGFRGIVVGNAAGELKDALRRSVRERGLDPDLLYFARQSHIGGVLEGCRKFGILGSG